MVKKYKKELIFLKPVLKSRIWGGCRLRTEWGYESNLSGELGECWAVSCNDQADCEVAEGRYRGKHLSELWEEEPEIFGKKNDEEFPLLVKIIDAKEDLSVQVHPDDEYAKKHCGSKGKWECWYILDCPENAELIIGSSAHNKEELAQKMKDGEWASLFNRVPVRKGDFIAVEPGTIHAITAGVELLEVQQNSDVTYRIYDYDRLQGGKPRELHQKEALEVTHVPYYVKDEDVVHTDARENTPQLLAATDICRVWTLRVNGATSSDLGGETFMIGSVVEGSGKIDGRTVEKGMHFIVPKGYMMGKLEGKMRINLVASA